MNGTTDKTRWCGDALKSQRCFYVTDLLNLEGGMEGGRERGGEEGGGGGGEGGGGGGGGGWAVPSL